MTYQVNGEQVVIILTQEGPKAANLARGATKNHLARFEVLANFAECVLDMA